MASKMVEGVEVRAVRCLGLEGPEQGTPGAEEPCQTASETREVVWVASCQSAEVALVSRLCLRPASQQVSAAVSCLALAVLAAPPLEEVEGPRAVVVLPLAEV